ncbi:MAG: SOS response-associated peptidase [Chloroflexi bacterium]|nr:SOS response-associated peptidase [Chloroflexota bacterium]
MCGRFTITIEAAALQLELGLAETPVEWKPRFNVAPTQPVAVVRDPNLRRLEYMRWGLVPSWAKDVEIGNRLINARSETIEEKPSFRTSFTRRRCLIPADGFYEWQRGKERKTPARPYYFFLKDHALFAFAGIWDLWQSPDGSELTSCSIITCAANDLVSRYHERMPVILDPQVYTAWLGDSDAGLLKQMLKPYPAERMDAYAVSTQVNSAWVDTPQLILPLEQKPPAATLFSE